MEMDQQGAPKAKTEREKPQEPQEQQSPKRRKVDVNGNPVDAAQKIVDEAKEFVAQKEAEAALAGPKRYRGTGFLLAWLAGEWEHDIDDIDMTVVNGSQTTFHMEGGDHAVNAHCESKLEWDDDQKCNWRVLS